MSTPPVVWTIAGFDPSSGAGITADLKTISAHGCYGVSCITALTVQNTMGVRGLYPVASAVIAETLCALLEDLPPAAIKIGMLSTAAATAVVADFLESLAPRCPVVIDPVLRSTSGAALLEAEGVELLRSRLLPLGTVVTPNLSEALQLTGLAENNPETLATALRQLGAAAAVVTGGDSDDPESCADTLAYTLRGMEFIETLSSERIASTSTHGTGCAFSTAIACRLALRQSIPAAVTAAKSFVRNAILHAPGLGHGKGPMALEFSNHDAELE